MKKESKFKGIVKIKGYDKVLFAVEPYGIKSRVKGVIELQEPKIHKG